MVSTSITNWWILYRSSSTATPSKASSSFSTLQWGHCVKELLKDDEIYMTMLFLLGIVGCFLVCRNIGLFWSGLSRYVLISYLICCPFLVLPPWPVKVTSSRHECDNVTSDHWNWNRCHELPGNGMPLQSLFWTILMWLQDVIICIIIYIIIDITLCNHPLPHPYT